MKRLALISDIHANLPALRAVLADIDDRASIDATYHLGDLTGYAPWPNEVVSLLRERAIPGISGNYDSTVAANYKHCGCRADTPHEEELSHMSFEWTLAHVTPETRKYLGTLPFRLDIRPFGGPVSGPTITRHRAIRRSTRSMRDRKTGSMLLSRMAKDLGSRIKISFASAMPINRHRVSRESVRQHGGVDVPGRRSARGLRAADDRRSAVRVEFVRCVRCRRSCSGIRESDLRFADFLRSGGRAPRGQ
jgi:hypothetical protein